MDNDKLVYELSHAMCDYLIKNNLCQEKGCDECINKYAQILINFNKEIKYERR